jgi:lipopolysaccharide/colanic/teichoic acid biosynthesis glycosyltransferase
MFKLDSQELESKVSSFDTNVDNISRLGYLVVKRVMDILISIIGLVLTAPIMLITASLIR